MCRAYASNFYDFDFKNHSYFIRGKRIMGKIVPIHFDELILVVPIYQEERIDWNCTIKLLAYIFNAN